MEISEEELEASKQRYRDAIARSQSWGNAKKDFEKEMGVGFSPYLFVIFLTPILVFNWLNNYFSTGTCIAISIGSFIGVAAGMAEAGQKELQRQANVKIINNT
jgi:uncharacterized membrane protein (DUF106 family)